MSHLIKSEDISRLSRPIGASIKSERVDGFIDEAEMMSVKPIIGDALYLDLLDNIDTPCEAYNLLLGGGKYTSSDGQTKVLRGLRVATAYYAYARVVKNNAINVTSFGTVFKSDEHSQNIDNKQILRIYDDAINYGNLMMNEVLALLVDKPVDYPLYISAPVTPQQSSRRVSVTSIGS